MDYDVNFDLINTPLSVEELEVLLNLPQKKLSKDKEIIPYLIRRSLATSLALKNARVEFDNEIRRRSTILPATGGATAMANPELAVKYLPPEELSKLFDKLAQEKLDYLNSMIEKTQKEKDRSRKVIEEVVAIAYNDSMPNSLKEEILKIIKDSKDS
jgi:hypothetical protein